MSDWPTILYFGNDWSAGNRTSSHHIATRLMRENKVIYIECPGLRGPQGTKRDLKKIFSHTFKSVRGPRSIDGKSYVYTLFQLPFHKYRFVRYLNKLIILFSVRSLIWRFQANKPILWFVLPHLSSVLGKLKESLSVYYCIDDYSSLPGVNKSAIQQMDDEMTLKADVVFVSSEPLLKRKEHYGDKVILSRHGVDFEHFNKAFHHSEKIPAEIANIKKPIIGFFGLIESWIDLDLIKFVAESNPEWNVLMVGRIGVSTNPCEKIPNIHFIGSVPYELLPKYAQIFNVAIIPCVQSDLITNFNPLKLREYLAMGCPVVSTYFPEIKEFSDVVEIADDYNDFISKIKLALETDSQQKAELRIEKVRLFSWDNRFKTVTSIVETALRNKLNKIDRIEK